MCAAIMFDWAVVCALITLVYFLDLVYRLVFLEAIFYVFFGDF